MKKNVVLLGGIELPTDQFTMVTDPYVLSLLQPQVKNDIVQVCVAKCIVLICAYVPSITISAITSMYYNSNTANTHLHIQTWILSRVHNNIICRESVSNDLWSPKTLPLVAI